MSDVKSQIPGSGKTLHFLFHLDSLNLFNGPFYPEIPCLMQAEAIGWNLRIGNTDKFEQRLSSIDKQATAGIIYMPDCVYPYDLNWPELDVPGLLFSLGEIHPICKILGGKLFAKAKSLKS